MRGRDRLAVGCTRCQLGGGLCVCALAVAIAGCYAEVGGGYFPAVHTHTVTATTVDADTAGWGLSVKVGFYLDVPLRWIRSPFVAPPGARALLLYPAPDAVPLDRLPPTDQPTILVVPDGTWRQAERLRRLVPGLRALPCVTPPPGPRSTYRLRTELRPDGLATLEAIARAYAVLEGPAVAAALDRGFRAMVERTLWTRGAIEAGDVTDGVPDGAVRAARSR